MVACFINVDVVNKTCTSWESCLLKRESFRAIKAAKIPRELESRNAGYTPAMRAAVCGKQNNNQFFSYHI